MQLAAPPHVLVAICALANQCMMAGLIGWMLLPGSKQKQQLLSPLPW